MFVIDHESADNLLTMTLSGFWTPSQAERFALDATQWLARLRTGGGKILTLCDASANQVPSVDVIARLNDVNAQLVQNAGDRMALIVGGSLAAMQARRMLLSDQSRLFVTVAEARAWLLA